MPPLLGKQHSLCTKDNPPKVGGAQFGFPLEPSLDVTQRINPNVSATLTLNTDFAETEVATRQTNLTRFPLFFVLNHNTFNGMDRWALIGIGQQVLLRARYNFRL